METMMMLSVATRLKLAYPTPTPVSHQHRWRRTSWRSQTTSRDSSRRTLYVVVLDGSQLACGH